MNSSDYLLQQSSHHHLNLILDYLSNIKLISTMQSKFRKKNQKKKPSLFFYDFFFYLTLILILNLFRVVILVSVYRYVVGISVVHDYDQQRKRFNLQAIAEAREKTQI